MRQRSLDGSLRARAGLDVITSQALMDCTGTRDPAAKRSAGEYHLARRQSVVTSSKDAIRRGWGDERRLQSS